MVPLCYLQSFTIVYTADTYTSAQANTYSLVKVQYMLLVCFTPTTYSLFNACETAVCISTFVTWTKAFVDVEVLLYHVLTQPSGITIWNLCLVDWGSRQGSPVCNTLFNITCIMITRYVINKPGIYATIIRLGIYLISLQRFTISFINHIRILSLELRKVRKSSTKVITILLSISSGPVIENTT